MTHILPDVLQSDLIVVFCGTAASAKSAAMGAYYANPTNAFWRTLYEIGLTPHQFKASDFRELVRYKIGLTDVAKSAKGNDSDLQPTDFDSMGLVQKIEHYQPHILAFTSKRAYRESRNLLTGKRVDYGWQQDTIGQTQLFVLPSPSGAARGYWDISVWQTLAGAYQHMKDIT